MWPSRAPARTLMAYMYLALILPQTCVEMQGSFHIGGETAVSWDGNTGRRGRSSVYVFAVLSH